MENMTKEQDDCPIMNIAFLREMEMNYAKLLDENANLKQQLTASGSVAAPKEYSQHEEELQSEWERGYKIAKDEAYAETESLKEALKELLPIAERYEPIPEYPNDKAIIGRSRKLISK